MTFPLSGTANLVTSVLLISQARVAASIVPGAPYPTELIKSSQEGFWPDPGMLNQYNVIQNQANVVYRM